MSFYKHSSVVIDEFVEIKEGTKIWHFSHISEKVKIGADVVIGQNVFVGKNVIIGNKCKIQNNVSVYQGVSLQDSVFVGPSVVFTNVKFPRTNIDQSKNFNTTLIKKGATLGANSTIVCGVTIGEFAFVGAGAVVSKDVPNFALMIGVPAIQIGWISKYGEKLDLPIEGNSSALCKIEGKKYILENNKVYLET